MNDYVAMIVKMMEPIGQIMGELMRSIMNAYDIISKNPIQFFCLHCEHYIDTEEMTHFNKCGEYGVCLDCCGWCKGKDFKLKVE